MNTKRTYNTVALLEEKLRGDKIKFFENIMQTAPRSILDQELITEIINEISSAPGRHATYSTWQRIGCRGPLCKNAYSIFLRKNEGRQINTSDKLLIWGAATDATWSRAVQIAYDLGAWVAREPETVFKAPGYNDVSGLYFDLIAAAERRQLGSATGEEKSA